MPKWTVRNDAGRIESQRNLGSSTLNGYKDDNLVCVEKGAGRVRGVSVGPLVSAYTTRLVSYYSRSKSRRDMDKNGRNNVNEILQCRRDCRPIVPNVELPRCVACVYRVKPAAMYDDALAHRRRRRMLSFVCLRSFMLLHASD